MPRLTLMADSSTARKYREEAQGLADVAALWRRLNVSPWMESIAAEEAMRRCRHLRSFLPDHHHPDHDEQASHEDQDEQDLHAHP
jgi:hypothetical protein